MKVTLRNYTTNAVEILIFTKSTRLNMTPDLFEEICNWPEEKKMSELKYMADTIPASWEFVEYTFVVEGVSRAYTHQQVRTRTASYAQQSMRVNNMAEFDYIYTERNRQDPRAMDAINNALRAIKTCYGILLQLGQPVEDARGILPTNIATNIVINLNLRTLSQLVKSRTGGRTQQEYQRVVNAMADEVLKVHPWTEQFLFPHGRNYFDELEAFAQRTWPDDLFKRGELLKIVDKMRKEK